MSKQKTTILTGALLVISLLASLHISAQDNKYWVSFKSKSATNFDPYKFFDAKTIENRKLQGLPLTDWYDLPVDETFVSEITKLADSVGNSSRWLNGLAVYASISEIGQIRQLSFVKDIEKMGIKGIPTTSKSIKAISKNYIIPFSLRRRTKDEVVKNRFLEMGLQKKKADTTHKELRTHEQIAGLEGEVLTAHGLSGKGIRIAVLDVGFVNADKHPAFKYLRDHDGIKLTYDFLHKKTNVYNYGAHGAATLSCIAGKYGEYPMGLAPDAEFLLARTEREGSEFIDEEDAWVAAAEWAEQHGAQIISSSLGYTYQRYFYADMNGHKSIVSRGATAAARKGILVCSAAGNEGSDNWRFIITPGDCDSVLTVGGYDPATGYHISFSSFGPTADKRLKPNVIAAGRAWVATPKSFGYEDGTSFSTPLMAGFAACVWQNMRTASNMDIFHKIETMGSLYPYFDFAHGYGIPKAGNLFEKHPTNDTAFTLYPENNEMMVSIATSYFKDTATTNVGKSTGSGAVSISPNGVHVFEVKSFNYKYLYAKLTDAEGNIKVYNVVKVTSQRFALSTFTPYLFSESTSIDGQKISVPKGWTMTVYFDNCIRTYKF